MLQATVEQGRHEFSAARATLEHALQTNPAQVQGWLTLATLEQPQVHANQTARVYHVKLRSKALFDAAAPATMDAYYTLRRFPAAARTGR